MKFYIAGKITGDPDYKKKFDEVEKQIMYKGHAVMNPACLKQYKEFSWEDYMFITKAMQMKCNAVFFLSNWTDSKGAMEEFETAKKLGQPVYFCLEDVPQC